MAGDDFRGRWLVVRRSASDSGHDVGVTESKPVTGVARRRHVRKSRCMHGSHQEIAGSAWYVTRKDAACPVGAVRGGCECDHEHSRVRIAETGDRLCPIGLVAVRAFLVARDTRAVLAQPCAPRAPDDVVANCVEGSDQREAQASACSWAWYELRTSGPDSTCPKPSSRPTRLNSANSEGV